MAIRTKLTVRNPSSDAPPTTPEPTERRPPSEAERVLRKERVVAAKDALKRSVALRGEQVAPGRAAIKMYLQHLNEPRQPDDSAFKALIEAPFQAPPKKKERR